MAIRRKARLWTVVGLVSAAALATGLYLHFRHKKPAAIVGVVLMQDPDPRKELPIADVEISSPGNLIEANGKSDSSGLFTLSLRKFVIKRQNITLRFRHPDYQPLDLKQLADSHIWVAHMLPLPTAVAPAPNRPRVTVGGVRVRYSMNAMRAVNIGSAVKTFQVENKGNVPCKGQDPCSPDGKWKAAIASGSLEAGTGNEFRNARVSCIAGPCPFTRIESDRFADGSPTITATARNWSDTATFLLEAEVVHSMVSQIDHESYPVIFGQALNFTLPPAAEGVSIQADIGGETIIFPMGPGLFFSWANCNLRENDDGTRVYRCELKSGYQFQ